MFARWLPLYLLGIAALTLFPFRPPECGPAGWVMRFSPVDFAANLLAFLPIGLALHRSTLLRTLILCFTLSLTIEFCQGYLPRFQDVSDLLANTLGGLVGHRIGMAWTARWQGPLLRPVTRRILLRAAAAILLVSAIASSWLAPAHDFSNWTRSPLAIGNSSLGNQPWMGEIYEIALFDRALETGETAASNANPLIPDLWTNGGPILWLLFGKESRAGRVDGPGGPIRYTPPIGPSTVMTEAGLRLAPSGVGLAPWVADHVVAQLKRSGEFTLDLRLQAASRQQYGPAHLFSLGNGRQPANLTLAQRGSGLAVRLRTPASPGTSRRPEAETRWGVVQAKPQRIRLSYDGAWAKLRVDNRCERAVHLALATALPLMGTFLGTVLVLCTALSGLALASFSRDPRLRLLLAGAGGVAAWSLLASSGFWAHLPDLDLAASLLLVLTLLCALPLVHRPQ